MKRLATRIVAAVFLIAGSATLALAAQPALDKRAPNVLVIVADDMGYNDIQPFGQTIIQTPNLSALAAEGIRFSNYHVQPTCSPTRAQLLTGVDNHLAGMGSMGEYYTPAMEEHPGNYIGAINDRVKTIAEVLRDSGYNTFMSGKWHLGSKPETLPPAKGFEQSFVLVGPGGSHWDNKGLLGVVPRIEFAENGQLVARNTGEFSSDLYTDKFLEYMQAAQASDQPFFGYLAFQAVHDPLQAPEEYIAKYQGKFAAGYDKHRAQNLASMLSLGVIPEGTQPSQTAPLFKPWNELTDDERIRQERVMEIYAGMLDNMDANIGRVLTQLKESGEYDNTVIFFFSDNGPSAAYMDFYPGNADGSWIAQEFDTSLDNMGAPNSFAGIGPGWAYASSTPYRLFKLFMTEGGTVSPLIVKGPMVKASSQVNDGYLGVEDIFPTIVEITGATRGTERYGIPLEPLKGVSFLSVLQGQANSARDADFERGAELFGNKEYRMGKWKLSWLPKPYGTAEWQLFDMDKDRGETNDLAAQHPEIVKIMVDKYDVWATENHVLQWDYDYLNEQLYKYFDWRQGIPQQIVNKD